MIKKIYLVIMFLAFFGCSKNISSNQVMGSWWSIEADSTYSESYVNEKEWVYAHESFGPFSYEYTLYADSISIGLEKWAILVVSDTSLVLSNQKEEFLFYKLSLKKSIFEARKDSLEYDKFQEEFINRCLNKSNMYR